MIKVKPSDFSVKTAGLPEEQKTFMDNILAMTCDVINKSLEGSLSKEEVETQFKSINESLGKFDSEAFVQLKKDNEELVKQVKNLGESIEKMKKRGMSADNINKFDEKLNEMLESEKFKEFAESQTRKTGTFEGFSLKDIVSMTNNYAGELLITQQQPRVVSPIANKRLHVRNVISTLQGEPEYPQLAFTQITDMNRNARFVTENGKLSESSISVKEVQATTKRLGTYIRMSKRMLKSRVYIRSYILNMLPEAVWMAEDWNMLFGDGNGENLEGITNHKGVKAVETIIGDAVVSGEAGQVTAIETYNSGKDTLITLKKGYPEILDGMTITFATASTFTALNSPHPLVKVNDNQILLKGVAYVGEETATSLTFKVNEAGFKSIETPNTGDAVKTAFAVMTYAQYTPNAIIMNPMTVNAIESEKDTTGRPLGLITVSNGVKYIAGRPIIEYTGIAPGKYLIGDFSNGANLVDYTSLTLEWAEDVECKLTNQVVLIAQEEVIFPIYNPWSFAYGDLEALKTAITKA